MAPRLTASGGRAILSWIEGTGPKASLRFADQTADGWSPTRVVASGDSLMANSADVPAVVALDEQRRVAAWLQKHGPDPEAYDIRLSWSKDAGRTWSAPVSPHDDDEAVQHGFVSLFPDAKGGVGLVWLDGRALASGSKSAAMSLRARSYGADGVGGREAVVDPRVCDCCPVSTAVTADGVVAAFRDRSDGEVRDIQVTRLSSGRWLPPVRVGADGWKIEACPVNGPAVSARGRAVAIAWFTVRQGRGRTLVAFSRESGKTFAPAILVDDEQSLGRPQVALLDDGAAAVAWVDFSGERSEFKLRTIAPSGLRSPPVTVAEGMGAQHPRLVRAGNDLILAWVENTRGMTRVRTGIVREIGAQK
jgi:hypothetical protein